MGNTLQFRINSLKTVACLREKLQVIPGATVPNRSACIKQADATIQNPSLQQKDFKIYLKEL